ncbi:MAG: hypothetical protein M1825_002684 [Sarcosagium campestre]|nr:MAG: hypothetical protein M1825_002684 [Sarcosagium campestre]
MPTDVGPQQDQSATVLQTLIPTLEKHRQLLDIHNQDIDNLLRLTDSLRHDTANTSQRQKNEEFKRQWREEIIPYRVNDDIKGLRKQFAWREGHPLEVVLSPSRPWNSWSYRASYPKLAAFLAKASLGERSKSQVLTEDFGLGGAVSRWESGDGVLDHVSLWEELRTRCFPRSEDPADSLGGTEYAAVSRMVRVSDISPLVASLLLGSTPTMNLYSIAPFLERYLSFSNWGQASLFGMRGAGRKNAYTFEYHFAFYFVPKSPMDSTLAMKDFRNVRRMAPFSAFTGLGGTAGAENVSSRYIYEEQLSFILAGQGSDVFTCYQLAEKYFIGPYVTGVGNSSVFVHPGLDGRATWTPSAVFLSWIMLALHHVRWRWQNAIEAVDGQIDTPSQIIFSGDNDRSADLLSDDPQFSRSKTYFWALQAYKMFEEKLGETISCWEDFRSNALGRLHDGRMSEEDWVMTTTSIDKAIDMLRDKLTWVQRKSDEVRSLRDGLFGASSLFDSRTTVRQGDNIRLLTYITLLFLPLSFCTSIFGMDAVLPNLPIKIFAITMPAITVFTVVLVLNLQTLLDTWEHLSQEMTQKMRRVMRTHRRRRWRGFAQALQDDKMAYQPPVRKQQRHSTHWIYTLFIIEGALLSLPVHELQWLWNLLHAGLAQRDPLDSLKDPLGTESVKERPNDISRAKRVRFVKEAENKDSRPSPHKAEFGQAVRWIAKVLWKTLLTCLRALMAPVWAILFVIQYLVLLIYFAILPSASSVAQDLDDKADSSSIMSAPTSAAASKDTEDVSQLPPAPPLIKLPLIFLGLTGSPSSPPTETIDDKNSETQPRSKSAKQGPRLQSNFHPMVQPTVEPKGNSDGKWMKRKWRKAKWQQANSIDDV